MKYIQLISLCLLTGLFASAQARWQADVSITSLSLIAGKSLPALNTIKAAPTVNKGISVPTTSPTVTGSITVHNENDDDAYGTTLVVTLPVEVSVVSVSNGGVTHSASTTSPYVAYITFDLGHMTVGQNITVQFTFTKSAYVNKVGAFAYSGSPDPNPANNYKDATF